ncbi:MAG: hypothetical protein COW18_01615 [Zetaproteobacteria bacterium CG12_big_fil_rev_8_21_14_0_65_54_13]|nr:MAG: hypothetical protein COW18_01615 [Zetaproteobacteria bacterium CG12_big_fil_rev_8_21_14_0_65_54_13]PIX53297.1 MAG: hypothetical protein COZ50_13845 [Zetaproteobacteria bacterium CG_4_10_14_3_um_filter_54_28]PJA29593.1 MAG: hypothetical protein CO188_06235 [Zetaproteobacteria bacterium CG_4_9_14_3_um_filter_54_145]
MESILTGINASGRDWLGLAIDIALMLGIFMLWLTWHRNGKRQQAMEQLLAATAAQLDEATRHLADATHSMQQLKSRQHAEEEAERPKPVAKPPRQQPERVMPAAPIDSPRTPPQNSTQATMILRMHREGEAAETIAERLDMPLAQVKLMLKLHAAASKTTPAHK